MIEKESIDHLVTDDLDRRNRNWDKVEQLIGYVGDLETLTTDEKSTIVGALNEIDSKIADHKAESASKHITESGSNENGSYIKFDDGTMICTMMVTITAIITNPLAAGGYRSGGYNMYFPATFYSEPVMTSNIQSTTVISSTSYPRLNNETTTFTNFIKSINSVSETADYIIHAVAIGRWK